ncbi:hypothetical protein EON81_12895 [bacterium]|nr:MAG: hypothetical protein EON81_12895 [bacterium]
MDSLTTRSGKLVTLNTETELLTVEDPVLGHSITIDLSTNRIVISAAGDLELNAKGRLKLTAGESIELESEGTLKLIAEDDAVLRGKMVRIN